MAYHSLIDTEHNVAFIEHSNDSEYGFDRLPNWELQFHPDCRRRLNVLRDVRRIPFSLAESGLLMEHSLFMSHRLRVQKFDIAHGESRFVDVAGSGAARDAIERYFMALLPSPVKRAVFDEMPSALAWLGLPSDYEIKFPDEPQAGATRADDAVNDRTNNVVQLNARSWLGLSDDYDLGRLRDRTDDDSNNEG